MKGSETFLYTSIVNFADLWKWFRVSRNISAISGMIVKVCHPHIVDNKKAILIKFIFKGAHKHIEEQRTIRLLKVISTGLKEFVLSGCIEQFIMGPC